VPRLESRRPAGGAPGPVRGRGRRVHPRGRAHRGRAAPPAPGPGGAGRRTVRSCGSWGAGSARPGSRRSARAARRRARAAPRPARCRPSSCAARRIAPAGNSGGWRRRT
jgi:hypothetical protein